MKNRIYLLLAFLIVPARWVAGQSYSIDWSTIDGGGGTSTNATYTLSGTIGQPDAGATMSGGGFTVQGGFWAEAIQTPGAPLLSILRSGPDVLISWPATPGFVLQHTTDLAPIDWQDAPSGSTNAVSIPATGASRFYRLRKP